MAAALEFLEAQGATRPELAECYTALADLYQRKLWHQLTLKLDQFLALAVVQAGDALIQLYNHFISDFETKINLLKFAHFTVVVSRQYLDKDAAVNYLEGVISKLHDTQEARVEEPILYVKMQIATFLLEKGNQKGCKKLLEEGKATLDSMVGIDPSVHGTYYWVCSQYHKAHQDYCEFYKSALLYLAYTTVESLSEQFKQNLAFDLSLAALLGENVCNFGELLAHPIIQSLLGTQAEWIFHMLQAFNSGPRRQKRCQTPLHRRSRHASPPLLSQRWSRSWTHLFPTRRRLPPSRTRWVVLLQPPSERLVRAQEPVPFLPPRGASMAWASDAPRGLVPMTPRRATARTRKLRPVAASCGVYGGRSRRSTNLSSRPRRCSPAATPGRCAPSKSSRPRRPGWRCSWSPPDWRL